MFAFEHEINHRSEVAFNKMWPAANLVHLTVSVPAEVIVQFITAD